MFFVERQWSSNCLTLIGVECPANLGMLESREVSVPKLYVVGQEGREVADDLLCHGGGA